MMRSLTLVMLPSLVFTCGCSSNGGASDQPGVGHEAPDRGELVQRGRGNFAESDDGGTPVAEIAGSRVTASQVTSTLLKRDPQMFQEIVNELILRVLVDREADVLGVEYSTGDVDRQLGKTVEGEIEAAREHVQVQYQMSLEEFLREQGDDLSGLRRRLEDKYRAEIPYKISLERLARFHTMTAESVQARRIVVTERSLAEDLHAKVRQGASFGQLARQHSVGPYRNQGGSLPRLLRGQLGGKVETVLFKMKAGDVSNIVEEEGAFAIYMIEERQDARTESYDDLESEILRSLGEHDVDLTEINNWYQHALQKYEGVKRYYDLPSEG